jgi:hypothetical protein
MFHPLCIRYYKALPLTGAYNNTGYRIFSQLKIDYFAFDMGEAEALQMPVLL